MLLNTFLYAAVAHILEVAQKPSLGSTTIYEASCQLPGLGEDFFYFQELSIWLNLWDSSQKVLIIDAAKATCQEAKENTSLIRGSF